MMSIYMQFSQVRPPRGRLVKAGDIAKQQVSQLQYRRAIEEFLGQSDKDYFKLMHKQEAQTPVAKNQTSRLEGLKKFFERGTTF